MKILASDFDNTIYFPDNDELTKDNIESIKKFITKGNIFCVITGRNYTDLKVYLNKYNIPYSYLICEDGAKIFNNMDYCIDTTYLDEEMIDEIKSILDEIKCDYYLDDGYNKTEYLKDVVKIVVNCKDQKEKDRIVKIIKEKVDIKLIELEDLKAKIYVIGDNDNDYEMLESFNGGVIKKHHKVLDGLNKKEYNTLGDYIEELMKN